MRLRFVFLFLFFCVALVAQENPDIAYTSSAAKEYEIAAIEIRGADSYEDYVLVGFSGLKVGQKIKVPGTEITNSVKRFWKQSLFSSVKIFADKIEGDKIWLTIELKQNPRVAGVNFTGLKKSEVEDLESKIAISKGTQITKDLIDRSEQTIKKYLDEKGYSNAFIRIRQLESEEQKGNVVVDIYVDKKNKVRVNEIYVIGNEALSLKQIDKAMKKTNRRKNILNLFRSKKFISEKYEEDKTALIQKYNEIGYRDAVIVADSVVQINEKYKDVYLTVEEGRKYYFRNIKWIGNTQYPSEILDRVLNIKKGSVYNQKQMNKRLVEDDDAVANLYKNNGYLFFNIDPVETNVDGDSIDIEMRMYEGKQATIKNVIINGNTRLYEHVIRRELRTKPGQLYSQEDLIRTLRELAQMKHFDEEKLYQGVDIQPDQENGTVDIVYNLETKSSDQIELSAGWGANGLVGSLGLKFTNFAIQNLFNKDSYRIVPQGEGQTLSIRAQTNGIYYQSYSISFLEPWLGGKRPNSLSVSAYYSIQTGISSSYSNYFNNMYYNYYGMDYTGNNYYSTDYDPTKYLHTLGVSVGFGKRLSWPDDYFTFYGELSYQRYKLQNWYKYYFGFENGICNDLSLSLNFSRNSISNPIYTRRGSAFTFSLQITPPYSAFSKLKGEERNNYYKSLPLEEKNKLIEYHKWKFSAKTFTPLTKDEKFVLMARAEFGFLGYFNKYKQSPFGKFVVGGDGMSGYSSAGTETIGLRGYESGALTPTSSDGWYNGNLYTRLTLEFRYPILLNQTTNIWALAFLEAGNCWSDFKKFNPFDLKRAAGVGIRLYLPMFGLLGIDWGYGFDKINGSKEYSGSNWTFVLGQEF
ncbi:MAG: BamA/TamA family outer membrane protein [Paludibacteraceae bacterium]|nr:BamA/TamA family outer membrane protein [Paludibacteraceae bacterium]